MEGNEREALIRVEEQLKNSLENQTDINEGMKELFEKLDYESKVTSTLKSDIRTHLETSVVQRENCKVKMDQACKDLQAVIDRINATELRTHEDLKALREELSREKEERLKQYKDLELFKNEIRITVRNFKFFVSVIASILALLTPYLTLIIKDSLAK